MQTVSGMSMIDLLKCIQNETQPIEGHDDPEAVQDCWNEVFETLEIQRKRPEIICLCGSTRFFKTFDEQNFKLTLEGKIVLSVGCNTKSDEGLKLTAEDKVKLDELHKRKIDLCDNILVLNVDGYIGESTRSEIAYAHKIGKPIRYLFGDYLPDYHPGD